MVPLPIVWNKRVIHQFWTYWNTTRESLNSSQTTKRCIAVLAILDSHFVTSFMNQILPVSIMKVSCFFSCQRFHQCWPNCIPISWTISLSFFLIIMRQHFCNHVGYSSSKYPPSGERASMIVHFLSFVGMVLCVYRDALWGGLQKRLAQVSLSLKLLFFFLHMVHFHFHWSWTWDIRQ